MVTCDQSWHAHSSGVRLTDLANLCILPAWTRSLGSWAAEIIPRIFRIMKLPVTARLVQGMACRRLRWDCPISCALATAQRPSPQVRWHLPVAADGSTAVRRTLPSRFSRPPRVKLVSDL